MQIKSIVPYRYWRNKVTGHKVSFHGAVPYWNDAEKANWAVVTDGFTFQWDDGTIRRPHFATGANKPRTREEAARVAMQVNYP